MTLLWIEPVTDNCALLDHRIAGVAVGVGKSQLAQADLVKPPLPETTPPIVPLWPTFLMRPSRC